MLKLLTLCCLIAAALSMGCYQVRAQRNPKEKLEFFQRPAFQWGASLGVGGGHYVVGPSADVHYGPFTGRVAPGLLYMSAGIAWRPGIYIKRKDCNHLPLYTAFYYHHAWLLANTLLLRESSVRSQQIYMLLVGARYTLTPPKPVYLEFGVGVALQSERVDAGDGPGAYSRLSYLPMGELRLGGIFGPIRFKKKPKEKLF